MEVYNWERLRKKYNKINTLKLFESNLQEKSMQNLIENRNLLLYDEKITAKRLGISYGTLKLLRRDRKISHVRIGYRVFYTLKNIENFITKNEVQV
jgi:hypothetical protein